MTNTSQDIDILLRRSRLELGLASAFRFKSMTLPAWSFFKARRFVREANEAAERARIIQDYATFLLNCERVIKEDAK